MSLKNFVENLEIISCKPTATGTDIARLMKKEKVGAVVVMEGPEAIGFITDRDLVVRCLSDEVDCEGVSAQDIMSSPVQTISEEASILELTEKMKEKEIRRLVIIDKKNRPVGMVSMADVFELLAHELAQLSVVSTAHNEKLFRRNMHGKKKVA
ncbi:MAG: CBS domain-containing protein [Bdellovibrionaceae bacterium]|nr:CBS domain-containing protein [Bdellovibrionales bacterium]MCB9254478.1 CBS domain-containing protein [Pseudobdellovibrionaceae bacterium]